MEQRKWRICFALFCFVHILLRRQCSSICLFESFGILMNITDQKLRYILRCEMYVVEIIDKMESS